jgi:phage repressor protein C with HTH and peptisase S24 domain
MDMKEIIERLKDIISTQLPDKKVYDKDVAMALGLSKDSLSHHKKRNAVPYEQIAYFCAKNKISINWLLFNQSSRLLKDEIDYTTIKYYKNINASAGGGAINFDEDYEELAIDRLFLGSMYKSNSANTQNLIAINVTGDSMYPTLDDKEIIIVDKSNQNIQKGGIFVLSNLNGVFVKRLSCKIDNSIEIISDNKNYNSEIVTKDEFSDLQIIGKVVGKMSNI